MLDCPSCYCVLQTGEEGMVMLKGRMQLSLLLTKPGSGLPRLMKASLPSWLRLSRAMRLAGEGSPVGDLPIMSSCMVREGISTRGRKG